MIKILKEIYSIGKKRYFFRKAFKSRFPTCTFEEGLIIKGSLKNMILSKNVRFQSNVMIHLGGMEWCQEKGLLSVGANSIISPNVIIYAAGPSGVVIGKNFDCGPGVQIFASRTDIQDRSKHVFGQVEIGNNVVLFANVVVSPGVKIGDNAVVLASSVVNKNIPPNTVYGGVPAKLIKHLT